MHPILKNCLLALPFAGLFVTYAHAQAAPVNQNGTLVEMCASAQQEVEQDAAQASISYKIDNTDKRIAADAVNKKMTALINDIKAQYPSIEFGSQNYNTYQQYTPQGKSKTWTVEQSFSIATKKPKDMPAVVAMAQTAGVELNGLSAYLTPEATRLNQEKLYGQAFADVTLRLNAITKAMGRDSSWQIVHIDTTGQHGCGNGGGYVPMMRSMAAKSADAMEVSQPTLEQGKQTVQLSLWVAAKLK